DRQDFGGLAGAGVVDEENLVESALAEQLGRKARDVVSRRDDEHRRGLLLQPGEQGPKQPRARARVTGARRAGKALLDLVDPQHARRGRLGRPERLADLALTLADETPEARAHVEPQQR